MQTKTLTSLFNAHRLKHQIDEVLHNLENHSFDEEELAEIDDTLYLLNQKMEYSRRPSRQDW